MLVLVRLASEINLKSDKVKSRFVRRLEKNIASALKKADISYRVERQWSRFLIDVSGEQALSILSRVFGIASLSPVEHIAQPNIDSMREVVLAHYKEKVRDKSYCIRAKRSSIPNFTSKDVELQVGGALREYAARVDLARPEVKIEILVTPEGAFFFSERIKGPGGLPLGVEGKALALISGGFDSPVAAWMMMKRGVELDFLFCNLAGSAYERATIIVVKALVENWAYGSHPRLYSVDFAPIIAEITTRVDQKFAQIVLKRSMYKVGNLMADKIGDIPALITGEAIGQVSSQTLHNIAAIDEASERVVLRPVISFDKEDIISLSRRIGSFVLCEHIKEYCQITNERPKTKTTPNSARRQEERVDPLLYQTAVDNRRTFDITTLRTEDLVTDQLFTSTIPENATVIDCRSVEEYHSWHYPAAIHMPERGLVTSFKQLDRTATYILYCPYGLQTAVIAEKMQEAGFLAYSFKGGTKALKSYMGQAGKKVNAFW